MLLNICGDTSLTSCSNALCTSSIMVSNSLSSLSKRMAYDYESFVEPSTSFGYTLRTGAFVSRSVNLNFFLRISYLSELLSSLKTPTLTAPFTFLMSLLNALYSLVIS